MGIEQLPVEIPDHAQLTHDVRVGFQLHAKTHELLTGTFHAEEDGGAPGLDGLEAQEGIRMIKAPGRQ